MKHFRSRLFWGLLATLAFGLLSAVAQSPTVVTRMDWTKAYGGPYEIYWQATPTTLTDVDTRDVRLLGHCVSNTTSGALTFTIQTKDASPLPLPLTGSIPANSASCNNTPFGLLSKGGFSVQGPSGLYYQAVWTH